MAECDLSFDSATVIDGTGRAPFIANVGVSDGIIVAITTEPLAAREHVNAVGKVVCPGFIDLHSHADFSIQGAASSETQLTQGVTTLVTGNCGFSPFPVIDLDMMRESIGFMDTSGTTFDWTDLRGFRRAINAAHPAVNIAPQVGHNALRIAALGMERRPPTEPEFALMQTMLEQAAGDGAFGFTSGLIYTPGVFADPEELRTLAATAHRHGMLYSTHMRNETNRLVDAVDEALDVARATGVRLEISHLKAMGPENHGTVVDALDRIEAARAEGVDATTDVYPYTASSTTLTSRMPPWAMDGGPEALVRRLAHTETRAKIAGELAARFGHDIDPAGVIIADLPAGRYSWAVGHSLVDIGAREGCTAQEAALRVLEHHHAAVSIINHSMAEADVRTILRHPITAVASDGWILDMSREGNPHPRSFGTFTRVLGHYARETDVLDLVEAVRKMTSLPASRIGLARRGRVATGAIADLVMFDPITVADRSTYQSPWQLSVGIERVLVAGVTALNDGRPTGARAGSVLDRRTEAAHA
ncbi:MAG: N-acyl-D-amino-acid deacylase family protein [Pseudoclavibacter sp.]